MTPLKINEVEALVGVTKKNIRFYEEQGLLSPRRNAENGYRDYGEEEVQLLLRIKLLRKLGVPIEEIRQMLSGTHTLGDGMRRHLISLEREQRNLEQSMALCRELQTQQLPLAQLDAQAILTHMEALEQSGTSFRNSQQSDVRVRYAAPVIVTVIMVAFMAAIGTLIVWACITDPGSAPPLWFVGILLAALAAVAAGSVLALFQRIREIRKGEIDDAKYY